MADYIRVTTQNIRKDREEIQNDTEGIKKLIEELYREMKALGQTWEGPAWQAFQNQVASDIENMHLIFEKLSGYLEHIGYAEQEYRNCENSVENLVDQIRI